jgi:hypothetical protein
MSWLRGVAIAAFVTLAMACSSISTVRVQPENVQVAKGLRPIAVVHAQVTSAYFLFLAIPGRVNLDYVVNRMLIHAAKQLGADKVVDIKVDITPGDGIWTLRKLIGWRSAEASGVAVIVEDDAPQPASPPAAPATTSPPAAPAPAPSK